MGDTDGYTMACIVKTTRDNRKTARVNIKNRQDVITDFASADVTPLFRDDKKPSTYTIVYYMMAYPQNHGVLMTMLHAFEILQSHPVEYEDHTPFRAG